jgi:hypothetical protein
LQGFFLLIFGFLFFVFFCVLGETFASSAFKNSPFPLMNARPIP